MAKLRFLIPLVLCACSSKQEGSADKHKAEPAAITRPARAPQAVEPAPTTPPQAGGLTWNDQAPLVRRAPKSKLRAAEYGIANDPETELYVTYFGKGRGGTVDANITRWVQQFAPRGGGDAAASAKRSERKVGEVTVTVVETAGMYGRSMPATERTTLDDAMLLGAVAEGPDGAVFFKLVGKRESVSSARAAFDAMLDSLRPAS